MWVEEEELLMKTEELFSNFRNLEVGGLPLDTIGPVLLNYRKIRVTYKTILFSNHLDIS